MHTNTCTQTHAHKHMHTITCTQTHAHKHIHTNTCTQTHAHKHMHTNTCTQTHTYKHIHASLCTCTQMFHFFSIVFDSTLGYNWRDGKPLSFINWYTNDPNTGQRHLCVGMNRAGKWWDLPCYSKYTSVCKVVVGKF